MSNSPQSPILIFKQVVFTVMSFLLGADTRCPNSLEFTAVKTGFNRVFNAATKRGNISLFKYGKSREAKCLQRGEAASPLQPSGASVKGKDDVTVSVGLCCGFQSDRIPTSSDSERNSCTMSLSPITRTEHTGTEKTRKEGDF